MPQPEERLILQLGEGIPLLISRRLTYAEGNRQPLMLETVSAGAGSTQFAYSLNALNRLQ